MILPFTGNSLLELVQSLTSVSCKVAVSKTKLKIESEIMDTKDPASISIVSDFLLIITNTVNGLVLLPVPSCWIENSWYSSSTCVSEVNVLVCKDSDFDCEGDLVSLCAWCYDTLWLHALFSYI